MSAPSLPALLVSHWRISFGLDLEAAAVAAVYLWGVRRARRPWPVLRTGSFLAGVACVPIALESGLDAYDDRLLSVHMTQHMLLALVAPLLLLGGHPAGLALRALPGRPRSSLARGLSRASRYAGPLQCVAVFYLVLLLTHLPAFYDAAVRHAALHAAEHVAYLLAGLALWWPLLDGDPAPSRRLGGLGRLVYMLAAMPPMALLGAYLNRHASLVYAPYGPPARALGVSALADQAQAGAIMWVAGNVIVMAVGLWAAMSALVAAERRQQIREKRALDGQRT